MPAVASLPRTDVRGDIELKNDPLDQISLYDKQDFLFPQFYNAALHSKRKMIEIYLQLRLYT